MDAHYFLNERTQYIRFFYDESVKPFHEIKRKIGAQEPPYVDQQSGDQDEPAYLDEWLSADAALDLVGLSCVSLLSEALKLYFKTMQDRVIGFRLSEQEIKIMSGRGFVAGYKAAFEDIFDTDWSDCNIDFEIIEQIILARNRAQHGGNLSSFLLQHDTSTTKKHPLPFFANKQELEYLKNGKSIIGEPVVEISRENLFEAIEVLVEYVTGRLDKVQKWKEAKMKNHK